VLLWLVIYLQDVLGFSAQDARFRLAIISGAQFATATIAGRFSEPVPARWLVGPGLVLVGVGLILMAGLTGGSDWTYLIPGFIVSGLGAGTVNPPLASAAIGVVPLRKAGMASGVNTTFRQIGIAAGARGADGAQGADRNAGRLGVDRHVARAAVTRTTWSPPIPAAA
jgi:predicted MFS family arabinose efflux permease